MTRPEILDTAKKCVCGDREQDYGSPESNFQTIADLWAVYLQACGVAIDFLEPHDVAAMLALLKIARIASGHGKLDNWVDLAGYAACGGEIESKPAPTSDKPEPWGRKDRQRKIACFCVRYDCVECEIYKRASKAGIQICEHWCESHPAEARKIMDEWECKHE